jgi:CTP:molybdopterin cytidylyltransferase MocA
MGFGAVILAAGLSSRTAPVNKLLMSLGDRPVIRHVVQTALDVGLDLAAVVIGPDREALRAALEDYPYGSSATTTMKRAWRHPFVPVWRRSRRR